MKYFYVVIFLFITINSFSAIDTTKANSASLTLAAVYSNNANYYGQTAEERLPYALTNASFKFGSGLWLSAGAYKLLNMGSGISASMLGVGYDFNILKNLTGTLSYSRSFYPINSPIIQASNNNTASASLDYSWNWLNTNFNTDYAFGDNKDVFVSITNSKLIDFGSLFNENDYISLEPALEMAAGTQRFFNTYYTTTTTGKKTKKKLQDKLKKPAKPGKNKEEDKEETITTENSTEVSGFDLLSYSLKLPLAYNRTHYSIEAAYQLTFLGEKVQVVSHKPKSFFNLSFYYQF